MQTAKITRNLLILGLAALTASSFAQAKTFKFGSYKPNQVVTVESDTVFETFTGRTTDISGSASFDPKARKGTGTLSVDLTSLKTGIDARDGHLQGSQWLDTAKYPTATFTTTKSKHLGGDNYEVTGNFTLRGVTKEITTKIKLRYLPESDVTRSKYFKGDVLQVQAKFNIKLSDYGIKISGAAEGKVANEVTISISSIGTTA